jgi:hypothetical protein
MFEIQEINKWRDNGNASGDYFSLDSVFNDLPYNVTLDDLKKFVAQRVKHNNRILTEIY